MSFAAAGAERRQFGRRPSAIPAYIEGPKRTLVPCIVRNVSIRGVFLEPQEVLPPMKRIRLVIPSLDIDLKGEVRHQTADGIGVLLLNVAAASTLYDCVKATPTLPQNIPAFVPEPLPVAEPPSNRQLRQAFVAKTAETVPVEINQPVSHPAAAAVPATTPSASAVPDAPLGYRSSRRPRRVVSSKNRAPAGSPESRTR